MIVKENGDVYFVFDPDTPTWVIVDAVGKEILALCDGTRTVEEITRTLCQRYNEPYKESCDHVLSFVNEAKKNRFLQKEPFPPPRRLEKEGIPLHTIWVNVTNRCNLRCIHCHLSSGTPLLHELTTCEIFQVIAEAARLRVRELILSGGEPLMRDDILDIADYACRQDINRIVFLTNGTLVTPESAEKLSALRLEIQVSLDGARKATHDSIRGPGSYERTMAGLQYLVSAHAHLQLSMTIMKKNIHEVSEMAALARELGITSLHFPVLQVKGRAEQYERVIGLEDEDIIAFIREIYDLSKREGITITVEKNLEREIEVMRKRDLCGAGCSLVSVAADGGVYPCSGLHEPEFCAGNVREKRLEDIMKESEVFKMFGSLSVLDIPECRVCDLKFLCGAGCHVDRYYAYRTVEAPTSRCKAQQEMYWYLLSQEMKKTG